MKRQIAFLIAGLALLSCTRQYAIEERAVRQMERSLPSALTSYCAGPHSWRIEDLKTVYVNDSICLLQFSARFRDSADVKYVKDLRYIYLLDMLESRFAGRPVYKEEFRNILCMPDDLILELQKKVRESGENVYNTSYGGVGPIADPID